MNEFTMTVKAGGDVFTRTDGHRDRPS